MSALVLSLASNNSSYLLNPGIARCVVIKKTMEYRRPLQVENVCVIAHLELPEGDEGEEEDGQEGEEGVGEALVPDGAELQEEL